METGHRSLHVWLSSAPKPAEAASGASGLEGTFGPFSPNNLPLLIVAAVLVILVIVAIFVVAGQLRRPSSSKGKAGDSAHPGTGSEIAAGRAVAAGRADDAAPTTQAPGRQVPWLQVRPVPALAAPRRPDPLVNSAMP